MLGGQAASARGKDVMTAANRISEAINRARATSDGVDEEMAHVIAGALSELAPYGGADATSSRSVSYYSGKPEGREATQNTTDTSRHAQGRDGWQDGNSVFMKGQRWIEPCSLSL